MVWIITIIVCLGLFVTFLYNSLISRKNQVANIFASMDALLKKRYDLIPNLVTTVQNYMQYEKGTLTEITELRTKALSGRLTDDEKVDLDNKVTKVLGGIMVAVENYPELKANQNFLHLQASLNEVEEQISAARRAYNATVTDYNNAVEMFPTNTMAAIMKYGRKKVFEIPKAERQNINMRDLFNK